MPRQARKESGTGIYHVMLRGINRQDVFEDAEDYMRMLRCMQHMLEQYDDQVKRLGEDRFFSGAFGVFYHFILFFVRFVWWCKMYNKAGWQTFVGIFQQLLPHLIFC